MNKVARLAIALVVVVGMMVSLSPSVVAQEQSDQEEFDLEKAAHDLADEILAEIYDMPDYGAFDWINVYLSGTSDGATVTLVGDVSRLRLKTNITRMLEDMHHVIVINNNLVDMSGGPSQARVRVALYNNIYSTYLPDYSEFLPGERAVGGTRSHSGPHPIHILVDEEMNVNIMGHVYSAKDKSTATMACERTPMTHTCNNNLVVVKKPDDQ